MGNKIQKFEDLNVWKEGMELVKEIYKVLENVRIMDFVIK